jgi:hypothetical protein
VDEKVDIVSCGLRARMSEEEHKHWPSVVWEIHHRCLACKSEGVKAETRK